MAYKSAPPKDSALQDYKRPQDFEDCYAVAISDRADLIDCDIRELATQFGTVKIGWANLLLNVRDTAMSPFGLKSTADLIAEARSVPTLKKAPGDRIGFFKIYEISENEMIVGEDDWHQDFRLSIYRKKQPRAEVVMTTVCQRHNLFGKAYLAAILPFHKQIVKSSLDHAAAMPMVGHAA